MPDKEKIKCIRCEKRKRFKSVLCKKCYAEIEWSKIEAEKDRIRIFGYPYAGMDKELAQEAMEQLKKDKSLEKLIKRR